MILNKNARLVWLDANRDAARNSFMRRGGIKVEQFDVQVKQIDDTEALKTYMPLIVNNFKGDGSFRDIDEVIEEILHER